MKTLTKKDQKIIDKINSEYSKTLGQYYNAADFLDCAKDYIKMTKEQAIICQIKHVNTNNTSRVLCYTGIYKKNGLYKYRNFNGLMETLGYKYSKNYSGYLVKGCGMDMNFSTHYDIISSFKELGLLTAEQAGSLRSNKPIIL